MWIQKGVSLAPKITEKKNQKKKTSMGSRRHKKQNNAPKGFRKAQNNNLAQKAKKTPKGLERRAFCSERNTMCKGTLLGSPNREPQEYSRIIMEYEDLVGIFLFYTYYILGVPYLGFPAESL